jgi:predicted RNA-binding protein
MAGFFLPAPLPGQLQGAAVCDLKAYVRKNEKEELFLESVNLVRAEGEEVVLRNLFGEVKRVRGVLKEVSLARNRILVEEA